MLSQPVSSSFSSARTLQADSTSPSFEGEGLQVSEDEAKQACALARSVLAKVQLPSPAKDLEESNDTIPQLLSSCHQSANGAYRTTPKKSITTANVFLKHNLPPTPEDTPTKSAKRSHASAFRDGSGTSTVTTHEKTTDSTIGTPRVTPTKSQHATSTSIPPQSTRRTLFHNTPKWSVASKASKTTTPVPPQSTHLPSPPLPVSPSRSTPPPPDLQKLQDQLAKPLPSDIVLSPTATSPYGFRNAARQSLASPVVIDEDESGTYHPNVQEREEEEDVDNDEQASQVNDKPHTTTIVRDRCKSAKACGTRLSVIEYKRFLESLKDQVSFAMVDQYVASNRGKRVFRKVLEDMFRERIEEA